jgi:glycosyltransferase involved in cell wall biosynthesis
MDKNNKMISVVIPVFRSSSVLTNLTNRLYKSISEITNNFEIIFVEDCGGDDSWQVIRNLSHQYSEVRGINLSRNFGQHNAILCGIRSAKGDIIVTMDDDLQHIPEELSTLIKKFEEGYDVVYGTPEKEQHSLLRNFSSQITKLVLQGAMGAETARSVSAFRVFKCSLRNAFNEYKSPHVNIDVLLTWGTTNFAVVKIKHATRVNGKSGYTTKKLLSHAINMLTGFSTRPLQIASIIGFSFALFGAFLLGFVLLRWLTLGSIVPGFIFLSSIIAIFSGAQLLALGIIGEYLSRMHSRTMDRPPYLIRENS